MPFHRGCVRESSHTGKRERETQGREGTGGPTGKREREEGKVRDRVKGQKRRGLRRGCGH